MAIKSSLEFVQLSVPGRILRDTLIGEDAPVHELTCEITEQNGKVMSFRALTPEGADMRRALEEPSGTWVVRYGSRTNGLGGNDLCLTEVCIDGYWLGVSP